MGGVQPYSVSQPLPAQMEMAKQKVAPNRRDIAEEVLKMARQHPELGQFKVAEVLTSQGFKVSAAGVRGIWKRHNLHTSYLRLMAKSGGKASRAEALSPAQLAMLKREQVTRRLKTRAEKEQDTLTEVRREELLQTAAKIFSRKGYAATSLKEICAAAGIQPNSLYYHFDSKASLYAAVHQRGMQRTTAAIRQAVARHTDPVMRLEAACATAVSYILDANAYAVVARVDLSAKLTPALRRKIDADRAEFEDIFRELIAHAPLPHGTDKSLFRLALIGAMNWTNAWYKPGHRLGPDEIGRAIVRNMLGPASARGS